MMNTLLFFMSLYNPRPNEPRKPQTNEAVAGKLIRSGDRHLDRIIALCSESVRMKPNDVIGKTTLDYFAQDFLKKQPYQPEFIPIPVPDSLDEDSQAQAIHDILEHIETGDQLTIDLTGGMRETAMLFVTVARYLKNVKDVQMTEVLYTELNGGSTQIKDSTHLYDLFDLISAADHFFSTGNADRLIASLNADAANREILEAIQQFSDDLAISMTSRLKNDLKKLRKVLRTRRTTTDSLNGLLFDLLAERFEKEFAPLLGNEKNGLPAMTEWCLSHRLYQQALTMLSEEMPEFLCRNAGLRATDKAISFMEQQDQNQRTIQKGNENWWVYPLFHFHFCRFAHFYKAYGVQQQYAVDLRIPGTEQVDTLYRFAELDQIRAFLSDEIKNGNLTGTVSDELVEGIQLYQKVQQLRNRVNHASSGISLMDDYVVELNVKAISNVLRDCVYCLRSFLPDKK